MTDPLFCQPGETGLLCPQGLDLWHQAEDASAAYQASGADFDSPQWREMRHRWRVYRDHLILCREHSEDGLYHPRLGVHHHHRGDGRMVVHRDDYLDYHNEYHATEVDLDDEPCDDYHPGQTFRAEVPWEAS